MKQYPNKRLPRKGYVDERHVRKRNLQCHRPDPLLILGLDETERHTLHCAEYLKWYAMRVAGDVISVKNAPATFNCMMF